VDGDDTEGRGDAELGERTRQEIADRLFGGGEAGGARTVIHGFVHHQIWRETPPETSRLAPVM